MAQKLATRNRHCAGCGAGLLHFPSVWRMTESKRSLDLCSGCARDHLARLDDATSAALWECEALFALPSDQIGERAEGPGQGT